MDTNTITVPNSQDLYNYINNFLTNPSVLIILVLVFIGYLVFFLSLGDSNQLNSVYSSSSPSQGGSLSTIIVITVAVFIVLALYNGIQYFYGVNIMTSISNLFSGEPQINVTVDQSQPIQAIAPSQMVPEIIRQPQVFNIPGNYYGYEDAKSLCTAYGARLATYDEIEDSYNKGSEWCNYGWSDQQMALFPTQKRTFDGLQQIKGHEHDCGRSGVNGGYIANPAVKFGANCYGYKPEMTPEEEQLMEVNSPYPVTQKDIAMENRVSYWKTQIDNILVSPFNYNNWSASFNL